MTHEVEPSPAMRTHTISVRVDPEELAAWTAARKAAGRGRMGSWVRSVVNDAIEGGTYRRAPQVPEVNAAAYAHLTAAANNLNQLTRYSHQDEALHPEIADAVRLMVAAAWEVRGLSGLAGGPSAQPDPQVWAKAAAAPASGPRASEALRSGSALPLDEEGAARGQNSRSEPVTENPLPVGSSDEKAAAEEWTRRIMGGIRRGAS